MAERQLGLTFSGVLSDADAAELRAIGSVLRRAHAFDGLSEAAAVLDADGVVVETNEAWRLFAHLNDAPPGSTGIGVDYLAVCDRAAASGDAPEARLVADGLRSILSGERRHLDLEYRCDSEAEERWFLVRATAAAVTDGAGVVMLHQNITGRKLLEVGMVGHADVDPLTGLPDWSAAIGYISERLVAAATTGGRVTAMLLDVDRFSAINRRLGRAAGDDVLVQLGSRARRAVREGDLLCRPSDDRFLVVFRDSRVVDVAPVRARLDDVVARPFQVGTTEVELRATVGVVTSAEDDTVDSLLERVVQAARSRKRDDRPAPITHEQSEAELDDDVVGERLRAEAHVLHAGLGELPDRRDLLDALDQQLARRQADDPLTAVFLVDIGNVEQVNEAFGHRIGDLLTLRCAHSLQLASHADDLLARFSDRTLAVVCPHLGTSDLTEAYAERLRRAVSRPSNVEGRDLEVVASVGIASSGAPATDSDAVDASALVQEADTALGAVRRVPGGAIRRYDGRLRRQVLHQLDVESLVRRAVAEADVQLCYQPIIRLEDQAVAGAEALLRLSDEAGQPVDAAEAVRAAERIGVIVELSDLVLRIAFRDAVEWGRASPERPVLLSVNMPGALLARAEFPAEITALAEAAGIRPINVCLEVNESVLMEDADRSARRLADLKARGFRLSVDDFGTGYSSLAQLKRFPLDAIKVDESLIQGLGPGLEELAILRAIMGVTDALGLAVVGEGVEDGAQLRELQRLGVAFGQGHLWSQAVAAEEIGRLLVRDRERADRIEVSVPEPAPPSGGDLDPAASGAPTPGAEESLDVVLKVLAHELRTPLSVITGYASLLEGSELADEAAAASTIGRAALRINRILTNLADAGAASDGTMNLRMRQLDVAEMLGHLVTDLSASAALVVAYTPPIARHPVVLADPGRIDQAVNNLLTNAVKFSPSGSTVQVSVGVEADWIDVVVTDEGPGIPAEQIGLIFRKYGRADSSVAGTGLGLYLARSIARAHGGDVIYRRRTDRSGSIFTLRLPRLDSR